MKLVDKTLPEFSHPSYHPLDGMVLLNEDAAGCSFAELAIVLDAKEKSPAERALIGWDKYNAKLDALDVTTLQAAHDLVLARKSKSK